MESNQTLASMINLFARSVLSACVSTLLMVVNGFALAYFHQLFKLWELITFSVVACTFYILQLFSLWKMKQNIDAFQRIGEEEAETVTLCAVPRHIVESLQRASGLHPDQTANDKGG